MEIAHYAGQGAAVFLFFGIVAVVLFYVLEFLAGIAITLGMFIYIPYIIIKGIIKFFINFFTKKKRKMVHLDQQENPIQQVIVDLGDSIGVITKISKKYIKKRGE